MQFRVVFAGSIIALNSIPKPKPSTVWVPELILRLSKAPSLENNADFDRSYLESRGGS